MQGEVVQARCVREPGGPRRGGGRRGLVTEFSRASRRRLLSLVARVNWRQGSWILMTLTFPPEVAPTDRGTVYERMKGFLRRVERVAGREMGALWRTEEHPGSGRYHQHLMLDMEYMPHDLVCRLWQESIGAVRRPIVHMMRVPTASCAARYLGKYVSKAGGSGDRAAAAEGGCGASTDAASLDYVAYPDTEELGGRWWGVWRRDLVPWGMRLVASFEWSEAKLWFYRFRRIARGRWAGVTGRGACGFSLFVRELGPWLRAMEWVRGDAVAWEAE